MHGERIEELEGVDSTKESTDITADIGHDDVATSAPMGHDPVGPARRCRCRDAAGGVLLQRRSGHHSDTRRLSDLRMSRAMDRGARYGVADCGETAVEVVVDDVVVVVVVASGLG